MKTLAEVIAEHRGHLTFEPAGYGTCECRFAFKRWSSHAAHVAAVYREARTITTRADLDALPTEAVIRDADGEVYQHAESGSGDLMWFYTAPENVYNPAEMPELPALVLWTPGDTP